ncbi:hypothetical protein V6N13_065071 [Hibiscus sabdariffa]
MDGVSNTATSNIQNDASTSGGAAQTSTQPQPTPQSVQNANGPSFFLSKTYDMVDDHATDAIISWSPTNNSFVVWNPPEFARDLLPNAADGGRRKGRKKKREGKGEFGI